MWKSTQGREDKRNWKVRREERNQLGYFEDGCYHRACFSSLVLTLLFGISVSFEPCNHGLILEGYLNSIKE